MAEDDQDIVANLMRMAQDLGMATFPDPRTLGQKCALKPADIERIPNITARMIFFAKKVRPKHETALLHNDRNRRSFIRFDT